MPEKWWRNLAAFLMTMGYACLDREARARWNVTLELGKQFMRANPKDYRDMTEAVLEGRELSLRFKNVAPGDIDEISRIADEVKEKRSMLRKCEPRKRMDNPWSESVN